jgi:hypothetical protein
MKTRISNAYRANKHIGWKKTVGGHEWFLGYGTSPADEAQAIKFASLLEAKWQFVKVAGGAKLSQADFDEVKDLVRGQIRQTVIADSPLEPPELLTQFQSPPNQPPTATAANPISMYRPDTSRRWLYATIDEFVATLMRQIKPDNSNADHMINSSDRITRAKRGLADMPLDLLRRKELDDWLAYFGSRPASLTTGKPIGAVTIRNISQAIRMFLAQCIEWEWWVPPPLWERAFKPYTLKKLTTDEEKRDARKRPQTHTLAEKRVLWSLARPFLKAMMALADWAGHTQTEISTLHFDEIEDDGTTMFIARHRHKTGVQGRWWIPPEPAAAIRAVVARTPRDLSINPSGLAFLTPNNKPLVHRANTARKAKSDFVGAEWSTLLRSSDFYGVRPISFKYMRKGTSQSLRDRSNKELSKVFCAQTLDDIQDIHYSRPSFEQLEKVVREIYADIKGIYEPMTTENYRKAIDDVYRSRGIAPPVTTPSAA